MVADWSARVVQTMAKVLIGAVLVSIFAPAAGADEPDWHKQTIVYKTIGPTKIEADVYRRNGDTLRPTLVWIHGGALIMGNREGVPRNLVRLAQENNYVLVSIDWRPR